MVKKASNIFLIIVLILLFWSCATYQPPPPSLYIGSLPQSIVAELSLEERILTEEAWSKLKQGKGSKAEKIISKLGAESPFYYVGLGYVYFLLNQLQVSEEFFKAALNDYPDMALIHTGLAQVYLETGRDNLAFLEYRRILKKEPEHPWAKPAYKTLKNRKAEEALNKAKAHLADGATERSKETFLKALYYSPKSTEAHLALSDIYKKEDNFQNALVHLKAASFNEPENKEILKIYGDTLFQTEQYEESLEIYERLLELEPKNKDIKSRIETLKNRLGIFELPTQYDAIPSSEALTKEEIAALLAVKFKGILDETSSQPPIIIDISTSWASKHIIKTTSLGILDVYPNHTFQPKKIVTRAETAETLLRLINYLKKKGFRFIQQIPPEKIQISDVSLDNYYYQPIIQIISYDIMGLSPKKAFNPELPVSGAESIRLMDIILTLIK